MKEGIQKKTVNYKRDENMEAIVQCCVACFSMGNTMETALYVYKGSSICERHLTNILESEERQRKLDNESDYRLAGFNH